jgi:hypothetical protein
MGRLSPHRVLTACGRPSAPEWTDALSVRHLDSRYFFDPLPFWAGIGAASIELPGGSGTASAPIVSTGYVPRRFGGRMYVSARFTRFTTHAPHADPVRATVAFLSVGARVLR